MEDATIEVTDDPRDPRFGPILRECGRDDWKKWLNYLGRINLYGGRVVAGVAEGKAMYCGFVSGKAVRLEAIAVHKQHQGQGWGQRMVDHLKLRTAAMGLHKISFRTWGENLPWWLRRGAIITGRSKDGGYRMVIEL